MLGNGIRRWAGSVASRQAPWPVAGYECDVLYPARQRWACNTPMKRAWSTATSSRTICCSRCSGQETHRQDSRLWPGQGDPSKKPYQRRADPLRPGLLGTPHYLAAGANARRAPAGRYQGRHPIACSAARFTFCSPGDPPFVGSGSLYEIMQRHDTVEGLTRLDLVAAPRRAGRVGGDGGQDDGQEPGRPLSSPGRRWARAAGAVLQSRPSAEGKSAAARR